MQAPNGDLAGLMRLAVTQAGVVSMAQCREYAVSTCVQRQRIAGELWRRRHRAFVVSTAHPPDLTEAWCLQLSAGPGSMVSGPLALRLSGFPVPGTDPIVVIPHDRHIELPGVRLLRPLTRPAAVPAEGRALHVVGGRARTGLRLAPAYDAFLDTLAVVSERAARDLLDHWLQQRWIEPREFAAIASARMGRGRRGAVRLRRLVVRALTGSRSQAEHRLRPLLHRSGTGPWIANHPVVDPRTGRIIAELDFANEAAMVGAEADGRAYHSDREAFERDRARQNELGLQGWLILRFTWEQITQRPEWVVATVREAVRMRTAAAAGS